MGSKKYLLWIDGEYTLLIFARLLYFQLNVEYSFYDSCNEDTKLNLGIVSVKCSQMFVSNLYDSFNEEAR